MGTFWGPGGQTPGCLYDLTVRGEDNDQLTIFSPCGQRGEVSWVRIVPDPGDGEAAVEVFVSAAKRGGISARHEYRVRDGLSGIFATTTFVNESDADAQIDVRDKWERFEQGGVGIHGRYHWANAVNPADLCGYAFGWLEPEEGPFRNSLHTLKAGETFKVRRFIAVANSPAQAVGFLAEQYGEAGNLSMLVTDESGQPVNDAEVHLELPSRTRIPAYPRFDGALQIPFIAGNYTAEVSAPGRAGIKLEVGAGGASPTGGCQARPSQQRAI